MAPGVLAHAGGSHRWRLGGGHACGGREDGVYVWDTAEVLLDVQVRSRLVTEVRT